MPHKTAAALSTEIQAIWEVADREGRGLDADERQHVKSLLEEAKSRRELELQLAEFGGNGGAPGYTDPNAPHANNGGGPGDRFIKSKGYQAIQDPSSRPQTWTTGQIEVSPVPFHTKGTLLETTAGGPGGGLVPPYLQPGIVDKLLEPLGVAQVFGQSQITASQVRYVVEGTAVSGAAGVAETGTKPESTLVLSETTEPIRKIATVLPVSDEMLEDAVSVQQYLNGRLSLFVSVEEERQLLRGAGGGSNELVGMFDRSGINTYTKAASDDNATSLARVLANTAGSSLLLPDTVIMHPTNWLSTRLLRDGTGGTAGNFYGAGPFGASANNAGAPGLFGQSIWNTTVVLSNVVGAGTALVGNFSQGAHIWRRGGVSVEATNSHSDLFTKNITMIRAESRLGMGVYRPAAFTAVSGLA
jgi:HK97 family phage major capsid protein